MFVATAVILNRVGSFAGYLRMGVSPGILLAMMLFMLFGIVLLPSRHL